MIVFDKSKKIHEQITEDTWAQGSFFKTAKGSPQNGYENAECACLVGWVLIKHNVLDFDQYTDCVNEDIKKLNKVALSLENQVLRCELYAFNDRSTFADVLDALRKADV